MTHPMAPSGTKICIYCLERKLEAKFNREHVIPEAFGTFGENNLVLGCVCKDCNQAFGDTIDLKLARDSLEGLDRYWSGFKPTSEFKSMGRRSTTIAEVTEGPMAGISGRLHANPTNASLRMKPEPSVGFAQEGRDGGRIMWFPVQNAPEKDELSGFGFVRGRGLMVYTAELDWNDARIALASKGYDLPESHVETMRPDGESIATDTIVTIGRPEQRAVAKIAFNYLAYVAGSAIARAANFDQVRNFVRYDLGRPPVYLSDNILSLSIDGKPVTVGHYLGVRTTREGRVIADVCLMLRVRYAVLLSDTPFVTSRPAFGFGHLFDVQTRTIRATTPPPMLFGDALVPQPVGQDEAPGDVPISCLAAFDEGPSAGED